MKRLDATSQNLFAALQRAVDGGVASNEAEQLLAKAERGEQVAPAELKALLEVAGDRFEAADRAAFEAVIGGQESLPSTEQGAVGRPAHQVWMADRAGSNVSSWWSQLGALPNPLFTDAPLAQVSLGGESFTRAELEAALGGVGEQVMAKGNATQNYVDVGGKAAAPFLDASDLGAFNPPS